jgi:diaminopimelate epimerase
MRFSKWHALGNAYVVVDADAVTPERARELCDPERGVGSDGVLEAISVDGTYAEFRVWNPDGSTAELSGNGARIAARWLAGRTGVREVSLRIGTRDVQARLLDDGRVRLELGPVLVRETERLQAGTELVEVTPVSVGNPHAVVRLEPEQEALRRLGPLLETHGRFPDRTNVRVWERGVGETSASGTSAVAAAAAAVANRWAESPVTVHMPGGDLFVELDAENRVSLTGPVTYVYSGETDDPTEGAQR